METESQQPEVKIGTAQFSAQNVQLREDVVLDEVRLEGTEFSLSPPESDGGSARFSAGELRFRASISEPNLNRLLSANMPPEAPVRNLRIALFSGKARITGQFKIVPFTVEAGLKVENGVRILFDLTGVKIGFGLPAVVVEAIEQHLNKAMKIDLTQVPFPIFLDEARCEPGRLTVIGKARLSWPPVSMGEAKLPFAAADIVPPTPVLLESATQIALLPGEESQETAETEKGTESAEK